MENKGLVSIIVPVYNQERYLKNSIPSLLKQSYVNIEIVLINDGSTDSSDSILQKYASIDSRIKIVEKNNGGLVDATLCGIKKSTGQFICFLDPDDYVGEFFIEFFMNAMDSSYDFIAAGYLTDKNGHHEPHFLYEDRILNSDDLDELKKNYLLAEKKSILSNRIFISRWNKLYSRNCIEKVIETFDKCKQVSLGEDSIFTYLVLKNSNSAKLITSVNAYYYNIGNQNSMMKTGTVRVYLEKCKKAYSVFSEILQAHSDDSKQAYILYYFLINSVFQRAKNSKNGEFEKLFEHLKTDTIYKHALNIVSTNVVGKKEKVSLWTKKVIGSPAIFKGIDNSRIVIKNVAKVLTREFPNTISDMKNKGFHKAIRLKGFRTDRKNAVNDLYANLPLIEERVFPIIKKYEGQKTDLASCPIKKNIFVFWWDGFENAPDIVQACFKSVQKYYNGCNVNKITKDTYKGYTTLHASIIHAFERGDISVQTFSDILRFNLLMNNGGVWIDATIFIASEFNLLDMLEDKAFESLEFSSSHGFLHYKENACSWSGYFIAARKGSLLVSVINEIFEEYYIRYNTYSIYFFIDAIFMLCKIYKVDDNALGKIQYVNGDMFLLAKMLNHPYDERCLYLVNQVPQKLMWGFKPKNSENSFYKKLILCKNGE